MSQPHPTPLPPHTLSSSGPGNTYEFCFSRCRTFLCSSWFWAVHADILGDTEQGVRSGGDGKEQHPHGQPAGCPQGA